MNAVVEREAIVVTQRAPRLRSKPGSYCSFSGGSRSDTHQLLEPHIDAQEPCRKTSVGPFLPFLLYLIGRYRSSLLFTTSLLVSYMPSTEELRVADQELSSGNTKGQVFVQVSKGAVAFLTDRPVVQARVSRQLRASIEAEPPVKEEAIQKK
jgi:hypothetical protein